MATRRFSLVEWRVVQPVFGRTLPYTRIRITDRLGIGNRPYTMNAGTGREALFYLHVGPSRYPGLHRTQPLKELMVHELTHVWQGHHSGWTPSFIFRSMWAQLTRGRRAYNYTPGRRWRDYNVEQQASIVEHWFANGMVETDPRFRYIRDHIRTGTPR